MTTRAQREAILQRERERFRRGPMTAAEVTEFESQKARVAAGDERKRAPQPQLELQAA